MLFDDSISFVSFDFLEKNKAKEKSADLTSVKEGFLKGNMFKKEYLPYKNYTYFNIVPKTKREELLLEIMELSFAINDLNLYLDLHPHDEMVLKEFKSIVEKACEKEMEFVRLFGPLELVDSDCEQTFKWIQDPWPWQNEGGTKYV